MWQRIKNIYHFFVAFLANLLYGFPSRQLTVVGVTGTDGKTTTSVLIYHILNESGQTASLISTVGAKIHNKNYNLPFHVTTPSPFGLEKLIKKAAEKKGYLVLETTSHAIDQFRVWGMDFKISVLTNITHEHLDYHKTYENYVKTKAKLLKSSQTAIVNCEDESFPLVKKELKSHKYLTYGLNKGDLNLKNFNFNTSITGDFNKMNILAAALVCKTLGIEEAKIKKAVATFTLPTGRLDTVYNKDFKVIVDFAHTPNAIEQVLKSLRPTTKNRIIHVFGSAGERDKTKRPLMGKASSNYADVIILTNEDPRSEKPNEIINEIAEGIQGSAQIFKVEDRTQAIYKAISIAEKGDVVIVTGKGHEKSMNIKGKELPWDEFVVITEVLKKYKK